MAGIFSCVCVRVPRALSALPQCAVQLTSGGQELLYQPTRQPPSLALRKLWIYASIWFSLSALCFLSPFILISVHFLLSFSLSPYISYIPLLFHHLPTFFVHFSLIFLYTCHPFCAVLSGLLSFSPHFFLFLLCLSASVSIPRSCLSVRIPSSLLPLFLSKRTLPLLVHSQRLSSVLYPPFWRATAGLPLSMHSGHVARQWLISTSISPEMNGSPPRCTRHAF